MLNSPLSESQRRARHRQKMMRASSHVICAAKSGNMSALDANLCSQDQAIQLIEDAMRGGASQSDNQKQPACLPHMLANESSVQPDSIWNGSPSEGAALQLYSPCNFIITASFSGMDRP